MAAREAARAAVKKVERLGFPFKTLDPFLFCVHHRDLYPAGDEKMGVAGERGNGQDFDFDRPYRFYHGRDVPGFPQHPHRGFETITATLEGTIDHTDSMGNGGRYGDGDLQWMTAGGGIVHGEMFPLVKTDAPNTNDFFQIWLNLPKKSKFAKPSFVMHWAERVQRFTAGEGKVRGIVWAGELEGLKPPAGPPDSYASQEGSDVGVWHLTIDAGGSYTLPAAAGGESTNRVLYNIAGGAFAAAGASAGAGAGAEDAAADAGTQVPARHLAEVDAGTALRLTVPADAKEPQRILVLQGKPIGEPVVQHGPFVMNTREEIMQAFRDYQRTQFGGWPWDEDAVVFPRDKGRFALVDGTEHYPPSADDDHGIVRSA